MVEDVLVQLLNYFENGTSKVLILVVVEDVLVPNTFYIMLTGFVVLILVVVEDVLVHKLITIKKN